MPSQYVGIDLHRRRSVVVPKFADGSLAGPPARIVNDPLEVARVMAEAGPDPEVVVEATCGWYWLADLLADLGAVVHLAHPLGLAWGHRRRKDDVTDASDLVDMLRLGRLPEAWVAPPEVRQLRELVRYRARLVELRTGLKNQVHAELAKEGVAVPLADLFGVALSDIIDPATSYAAMGAASRLARAKIDDRYLEVLPAPSQDPVDPLVCRFSGLATPWWPVG